MASSSEPAQLDTIRRWEPEKGDEFSNATSHEPGWNGTSRIAIVTREMQERRS